MMRLMMAEAPKVIALDDLQRTSQHQLLALILRLRYDGLT
jgi:hypothetical protein